MMKFAIEAPWYTHQKMVKALFEHDPDIVVGDIYEPDTDDAEYAFDIEVRNHEKFIALDRAIQKTVVFGNITLTIVLCDEENSSVHPGYELFNTLFKDNPIAKDIKVVRDQAEVDHVFVRFEPQVIQFYDDDLTDYNGNWNGIAEDIAREIFANDWDVNFCTADLREDGNDEANIRVPLGEWP